MNNNQMKKYTRNLFSNELDKFNSSMQIEFYTILEKGCIYIPEYICKKKDKTIYNLLLKEISEHSNENDMIDWSKHHKYENPQFLPTFNKIVEQLSKDYNIKVLQTRLNYYIDSNDWKPFHHDRHAYYDGNLEQKENYTLGVSFGYSRDLVFLHEKSGKKFRFPQDNGDIFGFDSDVNKLFMHGVPKSNRKVGPRFSIIIWGIKN